MKYSAGFVWENRNMDYYIDSHAHIVSGEFEDDLEELLQRAEEAGVKRIMIMCTRETEVEKAIQLVDSDSFRFACAYGIHPEDVRQASERWEAFLSIIKDPRITCVGEIGLDYYWAKELKQQQQDLFIRQIEAARNVKKPILVHSRDAIQDTYNIMKEHRIPGVMHCFSGSAEMAVEFTKLGYYLAFGGALTFKNSRHAKHAAAAVCEDFILSETDCPYMTPEPLRGTRNEPANILYIVNKIAEVRNTDEETMRETIARNYERFLFEEVK